MLTPNVENPQMCITNAMGKKNALYPLNGILVSHKKE
jgi:hypothetical protein